MSGNNRIRSSSSIYTGNPNNLEAGQPSNSSSVVNLEMGMGPGPNTSGDPVVLQNSSMMDTLHPSDLASSKGNTTVPTINDTLTTASFQGWGTSVTPDITGNTTRDRRSLNSVSHLTLPSQSPSQSMSLSNNNSNPEQEPQPPFYNSNLSVISRVNSNSNSNSNNSISYDNPTGIINGSGNPTDYGNPGNRSASSPINNSNNNNKSLGGKKKRKTKKVNRKQKKTKKVKRKVKKTMKKKQRKTKRKTRK